MIKGVHHLLGENLVSDLDELVRDRNVTAFIVYRDYYCEKGTRSSLLGPTTIAPGTKYFRELISVVSEELRSIIQRRSKFAPNTDAYKTDRYDPEHVQLSSSLSTEPFEYSHRFLYHHREELHEEAALAPNGSAITALCSYILKNPDIMYSKCDSLFSKGLVSHDTLPWLFHPNDVLVSRDGPMEIAYVLSRFPVENSQLQFSCWNWGYDGYWLRRKGQDLTVDVPTYDTVQINTLSVYPLRYATCATKTRLLENGKKFWNLRQQSFVSYEGPDYKGERTYVRGIVGRLWRNFANWAQPNDSRCIVDYQTYYKFHQGSEAFSFSNKSKATYDAWPETISNKVQLDKTHMILLPPGIHGFFMKEKKWGKVS
jgi:hypothetical protein